MTTIQSAPIQDPVVDESLRANKSWIFYFNSLSDGDVGTEWPAKITGITNNPTIKGKYFKNAGFIDFWVTIDPVTNTSSTFGSTFIDLPFNVTVATECKVVYGSTVLLGIIDPSVNRCFLPSWSNVTNVITVSARVFTK